LDKIEQFQFIMKAQHFEVILEVLGVWWSHIYVFPKGVCKNYFYLFLDRVYIAICLINLNQ